ncbi:hypothetical protein M0813_24994 [Anaeramoeba flamelloides]|uniref:Zona occludens toxin N-terminal domain-containing protein n=1 Tax=Anaeramoeba flamelloides TaxID=1746091 RepID=A0ABQ8Y4W5_9EUKA|nr:hypothetical protein M0813_24994 [Anaeramoeba flamelloides]
MFGTGKTWFGMNFLDQLNKIFARKKPFKDLGIEELKKKINGYPENKEQLLSSKLIYLDMQSVFTYDSFYTILVKKIFNEIQFEVELNTVKSLRTYLKNQQYDVFLQEVARSHHFYIFLDEIDQIENWIFQNISEFMDWFKKIKLGKTKQLSKSDFFKLAKYYFFWKKKLLPLIVMENVYLLCAGKSWNFSLICQGYLEIDQVSISPSGSYRTSLPPFTKENLIQLFKESFIYANPQNTDKSNVKKQNVTYYEYMFGLNNDKEIKKEKEKKRKEKKMKMKTLLIIFLTKF